LCLSEVVYGQQEKVRRSRIENILVNIREGRFLNVCCLSVFRLSGKAQMH
jgi:hypothetical protein